MKFSSTLLSLVMAGLAAGSAEAQISVKLGVLTDRTGAYSDIGGEGSAVAARMAVEDFMATSSNKGIKAEVVTADHQNKPDIGSSVARQWYDQDGVDVIRSEEHTSELQSRQYLVCRLLLEKKKHE